MPLFLQRYSHGNETFSHQGANEADQDLEKMWSQSSQYTYPNSTDRLNRERTAGAPRPLAAAQYDYPLSTSHYQQYGGQTHDAQASRYGGSGAGGRMVDPEREINRDRQHEYGAGYGGDFQGSQGYGWQQPPAYSAHEYGYGGPVYPAPSAGEWHHAQRQESHGQRHEEQYAQPQYDPPHQSYEQHGGYNREYDQRPLMPQYHAANQLASIFNASAPAFTPLNAPPPPSVERHQSTQFGQNPTRKTHGFDPILFNPSFAPQTAQGSSPLPLPPPVERQTMSEYHTLLGEANLAKQARKAEAKKAAKAMKQPPEQFSVASAVKTRSQTAGTRSKVRMAPEAHGSRFDVAEGLQLAPTQPRLMSFPSNTYSSNLTQSPPHSPQVPRLNLLKRPEPTWTYKKQAEQAPGKLANGRARPLLVVLDLNGTLLYRKARGGSNFIARPRVAEFLHYLLTNHKVMIWSSAQPDNVEAMCRKIFTPQQRAQLVGIWARDKMRLTPEHYIQKIQCYKQLSWVWRDDDIAASRVHGDEWAQDNTVLIDDSEEKAASESFNLIKIDEFEGTSEQLKTDVLGQVVEYLEVLKGVRDVSACIRAAPYCFRPEAEAAFDWMPVVNDML